MMASGFSCDGATVQGLQSCGFEVAEHSAGQVGVVFETNIVVADEGIYAIGRQFVCFLVLAAVGVADHGLEFFRHQVDVAADETEHLAVVEVHGRRRLVAFGVTGKRNREAVDNIAADLRGRVSCINYAVYSSSSAFRVP